MNQNQLETVTIVRIAPSRGLAFLRIKDLWEYRELIYFLVWRDIKVRYKQTVIGAAWVILQPLITMLIFTIVFGNFARIPSDGLPYSIFAYTALLPWNYFAESINRGGTGLVANTNLISKVYFPRLIIPLSAIITPVIDFLLSFLILLAMMIWFGIKPTWAMLTLPFFFFLAVATAFAVTLWLSALNVRYRDVGYVIPFVVQVWLWASPVVYPVSLVPEKWRLLYCLNPMAGVIEGFRWALLGKESPDLQPLLMSVGIVALILCGGVLYFKRTERTFADVI